MSYIGVGHVIFSLHLGVGHSVLLQLEGVGHVFSNQHISKCSGPPPLYFLTSPLPGTIGHIDECHYVSTTAFQSNASISMCNELMNDTRSSRNKHFIMSICSLFLCHQIMHLLGFFNTTGSP